MQLCAAVSWVCHKVILQQREQKFLNCLKVCLKGLNDSTVKLSFGCHASEQTKLRYIWVFGSVFCLRPN